MNGGPEMNELATVGGFEVGETIGEGGMGTVYRGRHRGTGVEVAIKVIKRRVDDETLRRFHREVQSQARLVHPGIVYLLEYGTVSEEAAVASGGELRGGSPFVAMELADRGSLHELSRLHLWRTVRQALGQVLEALAFAHARDVLHRDLKPGNLLAFDRDDGTARVKLGDFGLAHILGEEEERDSQELSSASGTPQYIAPEQTRGAWREYGPWTDLYALGCIAWELVCAEPPFTGGNAFEIMVQHGREQRPALEPEFPVPEGLEAWIHRMMAIEPEERYQRAADALRALRDLEAVEAPADPDPAGPAGDSDADLAPTIAFDTTAEGVSEDGDSAGAETRADVARPTMPFDEPVGSTEEIPEPLDASEVPDRDDTVSDRAALSPDLDGGTPVVPSTWRRPRREQLPSQVVGTGLGLFDLREPPFVDRDAERDRIWDALRTAEREGEPRVVVVSGESGSGKSRLVEWTAARADEFGATRVMWAMHGRGGESTGEGVAGMVRRLVRGQKLDRGELYEWLLETLPVLDENGADREMEARAICELVYPTDEDRETVDGPRFRFASTDHKCALVARLLRRYGGDRPAFVWLDDAQWSELAMDLVEYLTRSSFDQPPALLALTVRSEALNEHDRLRERVELLVEGDDCTHIRLDPLEREDHGQFVGRMLPLGTELADRIAERTEGNPLFATQLLGHLVEKQQLEVGPEGFEIAEGAELEVPDEIHELWMRRLSRLVAGLDDERPEGVWAALERAAALGREVDGAEWRALCDQIGLARPNLVRDLLVERGLADRTDDGWSFAHDLLVDALHRRARERGEWAAHNRRCAELLGDVYPERPKRTAVRRADHWIAGGEPEEALDPLLEECRRLAELGDYESSREKLERRGELLEQLGISGDDPRSIENDLDVARLHSFTGTPPGEVLDSLEEARARAERIGDDRLVAKAANGISEIQERMGNLPASREAARRATERATGSGETEDLLRALDRWGWVELVSGNFEAAEERISEARRRAIEQNDGYRHVHAQRNLAWIQVGRGRDERAAELFEQTLEAARDAGYRQQEGRCHNGLGEIARFAGRAEEARRHYRRYAQIFAELGISRSAAFSHLNLAEVELMEGRFEAARDELEEAEYRLEGLSQRVGRIHLLRLIELTLAAGTEAWSAFDEQYAHYEEGWPEGAPLIKDNPWLLEMAGDYAAEAGERDRAERVWQLSRELWDRLDNAEAAERVDEKLAGGPS